MRLIKFAALSLAAGAALAVAAAPAIAKPHRHQVCKIERVHGHAKRVCHWVR